VELQRFDPHPTTLFEVLWTGSYPRILDRRIPAHQWLADHVATYVQRDVRQLLNIGDPRLYELRGSRDGRTLYYLEATKRDAADAGIGTVGMNLVAARVRTAPTFEVESRTVVIANIRYQRPLCCTGNCDVLPDRSGFIMASAARRRHHADPGRRHPIRRDGVRDLP